jgi:hypothetical protein
VPQAARLSRNPLSAGSAISQRIFYLTTLRNRDTNCHNQDMRPERWDPPIGAAKRETIKRATVEYATVDVRTDGQEPRAVQWVCSTWICSTCVCSTCVCSTQRIGDGAYIACRPARAPGACMLRARCSARGPGCRRMPPVGRAAEEVSRGQPARPFVPGLWASENPCRAIGCASMSRVPGVWARPCARAGMTTDEFAHSASVRHP